MVAVALKRIGGPVTELSGPADFNTLTTTGVWHQSKYENAQNSTNGPVNHPGLLEVLAGAGIVYQRFTAYRGGGVYSRDYYAYADEWSAWRELT